MVDFSAVSEVRWYSKFQTLSEAKKNKDILLLQTLKSIKNKDFIFYPNFKRLKTKDLIFCKL